MMENKLETILRKLNITEDILNVYPYGSRVYGTAERDSDYDYIIVTKSAFLSDGSFKRNAISSEMRDVQGILYSRTGFIDAINKYDISALECLSLNDEDVLQKKWSFKIQKWDNQEMVKNIIIKASNSWHIADMQGKDGEKYMAKKGIFHALRILNFGLQLKEHQKIVDFECCNYLWEDFKLIDDEEFDTRDYIKERDELMKELRS